jgi:serine/threonine protein kinase
MEYESPETVPAEWQVGDVILNRYEVRQKFEGGGMGMVYRVYHREWDMELAVKAPRADFFQTTEQKENFEREAETWVNLGLHPHVASCYYLRRLGGIPRLFAEFVEGGTLNDWIREGRLYEGDPNSRTLRVLDIAIQVAWALSYAHKKGLVHQDVKPANILMMPDGTAKLTDFGLARARSNLASTNTSSSTLPGRTVWVEGAGLLTPEYAAPEQFTGDQVSSHSDGWSWALTVLEMMQGERGWADGRFGPEALSAHYQDRLEDDPVGRILEKHLKTSQQERSGSLETTAELLIDVYQSVSSVSYNRAKPNHGELSLTSDDLNNRGVALLELGQQEKAEQFFWDAYALDDRNPHVVFNLEVANWRGLLWPASTDLEVIDHLLKIRDASNSSTITYLLSQLAKERGFPQKHHDGVMPSRDQMVAGLRKIAHIKTHNETDAPSLLVLKTSHCAKDFIGQQVPQILGLDCNGTLHKWSLEGELQFSFPLSSAICPSCSTSVFRGGIFTEDLRWLITTEKVTEGVERDAPSAIHLTVHDTIDGKRMSSQLAHQARNGPYHSFWDKPGLNCLQLLSNELLVTVGHNDWLLRVWSLPELAMIAEITLPKEDSIKKHRTATQLLEDKTETLGHFRSKVGLHYTVELTGNLLNMRKVAICCWTDSSAAPKPDADAVVIGHSAQTKNVALAMTFSGHPYWMAPDRKSIWANVRDIARETIWAPSPVDAQFYLASFAQNWHKSYSFVTHCRRFSQAAFTQNSDYLVFAGGGYSHVNGDHDKGHLHLVDTATARCLCTLVESAFERSVLCAYTTDQEIVVLLCHGSSISECRFGRSSHREFLSLARPRAVESLQNAELQRNFAVNSIRVSLCEKHYLHSIALFQRAFDPRHFFRDSEIKLLERRIVQNLKPTALKAIIWEYDFDFHADDLFSNEGLRVYEAFTCVTGMHVLLSEQSRFGEDSHRHQITDVVSGNSAEKEHFPQILHGRGFFYNHANSRLIRITSSGERFEACDDLLPKIVSVSNNYALGSDSAGHLAIWRLEPFERILITDDDWEADFVEGLLSLERNPGAHVRLNIALHNFAAAFVASHGMRVFRSFVRHIKADDIGSIFARIPQKMRHCYNVAATEANVHRVSRRDANEAIKKIYEDFVEDDISAIEGGGVISQDGKWIIVAIHVETPDERTLLVQFSSKSLQTGFLF